MMKNMIKTTAALAPFVLLVACGGGGDGTGNNAVYADPVIVNAGLDKSVNGGAAVTLAGSVTDQSFPLSAIKWEQTAGPVVTMTNAECPGSVTGTEVRSATCTMSFNAPRSTIEQTLSFRLTATDSKGYAGADSVSVMVSNQQIIEPNSISANAGPDISVYDGKGVTVSGSAKDTVYKITGLQWTQTGGEPVAFTGDCTESLGKNGIGPNQTVACPLSFHAPSFQSFDPGTNEIKMMFTLNAQGSEGQNAIDSMVVTVKRMEDVNMSLDVNAGKNQAAKSGDPILITGTAMDSETTINALYWSQTAGVPVTFEGNCTDKLSANARPGTESICPLSFVAPSNFLNGTSETTLTFRLTAVNARGFSQFDSTDIVVTPPEEPIIEVMADAGADQSVVENAKVYLDGSKSVAQGNKDGTGVKYNWALVSPLNTPISISGATSPIASFTAPPVNQPTEYAFRLTVTDVMTKSDTDNVVVTVYPANQAPTVANAGDAQIVKGGSAVTLDASESVNPLGGAIYYQWKQISGTAVTLSNATTVRASFLSPTVAANETMVFEVRTSRAPITASTVFAASEVAQTVVLVTP